MDELLLALLRQVLESQEGGAGVWHSLSTWLVLALAGYCAQAIREMRRELAVTRRQLDMLLSAQAQTDWELDRVRQKLSA